MIDGMPVVDAHLHPAHLWTLKVSVQEWAAGFNAMDGIYDDDGRLLPAAFDAYLEAEGVDVALMFCEYSPQTTGMQPIEDLVGFAEANPFRLRFLANLNPHYHEPLVTELDRQLDLGASALKLHPVHARFAPNDAVLWPVYVRCVERNIPVVFHCGTSVFPGAVNRYADPGLIDEVAGAFPDLKIVLAHGGRGWWYDAAAFITLMRDNVWIELGGLPPKKLPQYYRNFDLGRLGRKFIFATDWPGVPGIARNAAAVADLGFDRDTLELIFWRNAFSVYAFGDPPTAWG